MVSFTVEGKQVSVFPSAQPDRPLICLNTFAGEGAAVYGQAQAAGCPDFSLVAVSGLAWDHDMAPWDIPPLAPGRAPCTGGADAYLELLVGGILPRAEQAVPGCPAWRGIAGYSLAGLFALYALYGTDRFSRAASVSGSLWYPGLRAYLQAHAPRRRPDCLYFSLGDREQRTRNPVLKTVQQDTEAIADFYRRQGIPTVFALNPGGHTRQSARRTAAALCWLLAQGG